MLLLACIGFHAIGVKTDFLVECAVLQRHIKGAASFLSISICALVIVVYIPNQPDPFLDIRPLKRIFPSISIIMVANECDIESTSHRLFSHV